jgi:DNA (cytosine-5)-methyltransferase 1
MTRPPQIRAAFESEVIADLFAGGGGTSEGVEQAVERPVDIAINHSPEAIAMHRANHPETKHYCEDIYTVDPVLACAGRPLGFLWASPDCTFFSKARGTKPMEKNTRSLAEVVVRWAKAVRPRVIAVENVEEFMQWGPLGDDNRPDKSRKGETFREWLGALSDLGYVCDYRLLVAADYGAPTTRKRFFMIARCDGQPLVWPEPTHGKGREHAWRAAAEIIDWSIPGRSIFGRERPLAEATLKRIAKGLERYVFGAARPFIVPLTHQGDSRVYGVDDPLRTITGANRGEFQVVNPFVVRHGHYSTKTGAGLIEGRGAGTFRGQPLGQPLATICATNDKHLVAPVITKHYGGPNGHATPGADARSPLGAITAIDHHALTAAYLRKDYGTSHSASVEEPLPTITANDRGGGHLAEVRAFLIKYYRTGTPRQVQLPLDTVTTKDRFGLVMVHGEPYQIVDITTRMLQPRELFGGNGFPPDYVIDPEFNGKPLTKTAQIECAGNAVPPQWSEAIARANMRAA